VSAVDTDVVYEADEFDFEKGTTPFLRHKRVLHDRGNVIATYAIAYMKSGPPIFEIMDEAEMAMITNASSSRDYETKALIGPWLDWPDEMRRKSAIRRLDKRLPLSYLAERALQYEAEIDERYSEQQRIETAERRQLPASTAAIARGAFTGEPVAEAAGDTESGEAATDTADGADGAAGAVTDGQATCGAAPPEDYEGGPCELGPHTAAMHRNAAGETWSSTDGS
jgi:recombination protein RecT